MTILLRREAECTGKIERLRASNCVTITYVFFDKDYNIAIIKELIFSIFLWKKEWEGAAILR